MKRVFLGGTCNESTWRDLMQKYLDREGLEYFNPVVEDWNEKAQQEELREREECGFCLYALTPLMSGTYAVAEVVDDSNKRPLQTVFVLLRHDGDKEFNEGQWKSLKAVGAMVRRNGGAVFNNLKQASLFIAGKPHILDR